MGCYSIILVNSIGISREQHGSLGIYKDLNESSRIYRDIQGSADISWDVFGSTASCGPGLQRFQSCFFENSSQNGRSTNQNVFSELYVEEVACLDLLKIPKCNFDSNVNKSWRPRPRKRICFFFKHYIRKDIFFIKEAFDLIWKVYRPKIND